MIYIVQHLFVDVLVLRVVVTRSTAAKGSANSVSLCPDPAPEPLSHLASPPPHQHFHPTSQPPRAPSPLENINKPENQPKPRKGKGGQAMSKMGNRRQSMIFAQMRLWSLCIEVGESGIVIDCHCLLHSLSLILMFLLCDTSFPTLIR